MDGIKDIAGRLRLAREAAGYSEAKDFWSAHLKDKNIPYATYVSYENGTRGIKNEKLSLFAKLLNVNSHWLLTGDGDTGMTANAEKSAAFGDRPGGNFAGKDPDHRIPVIAYAAASGERCTLDPDMDVVDSWIMPIPAVRGNTKAFGVRIMGDSMEPRYFHGEIIIVNPVAPVIKDRDVVIKMRDGTALIKRYIKTDAKNHIFRQYNPDKEIAHPKSEVKELWSVVGRV